MHIIWSPDHHPDPIIGAFDHGQCVMFLGQDPWDHLLWRSWQTMPGLRVFDG